MLTREFLLSRGYCCGLGCANCPYIPKHVKGSAKIESRTDSQQTTEKEKHEHNNR